MERKRTKEENTMKADGKDEGKRKSMKKMEDRLL